MNVPRSSWILFVLYLIISIVVLMGSFISPVVRQFSYAPLRELILPPPQPIVVKLLYSTEKEAWLTEEIKNFYATDKRVNGRSIKIEAAEMGSRELILDVLDGNRQPVLISPASSLQVSILQDLSTSKFGYALVNAADRQVCKPVLNTPLVLAAWRERANVLWGDSPSSINIWKQLHDAVSDPAGWASRGHAEWGYVKFGHTSPLTSNSGFMTLVSLTFDYFGKTSALNPDDILSNPDYKYWLLGIEDGVNRFGDSTNLHERYDCLWSQYV